MQNIKETLKSKRFWLGTVLPFALAVAAAFVARYQLEISDGVTANYMAGQWPVYAPLNALTAFCLTLVVFALCGSWGIATGVSGLIFTVLALVNYYTRDLHGSALMPQDILNLGTAAEVMGSYTLHITQTVITIALLYIPVLVAAVVQVKLAGKHKRSWKQRGAHALACACGIFAVLYLGYFSPNPIKPATTYGGKFHADDVFATALLMIVRPDIKVTRGFVVPDGFDGIVYDVGCGMFDHHQEPRESRPNGVPYAAFGLLWRVLGAQLVGAHQARLLDENFVQPLDLNDNTGEQNSLADAIGSFNPVWDSGEDSDACFWRAVPFAKQVLENEIAAANAVNRADETVQNAYKNSKDGIVVLPDYMPWKNGLYKTDALFVVYPSQRGGYSAQCVTDYKTRRSKVPFPPAWGGQPEEILREKSGLALKFCHPSRFLVTAETKEDAIEACRRALRAAGRPVSAQ